MGGVMKAEGKGNPRTKRGIMDTEVPVGAGKDIRGKQDEVAEKQILKARKVPSETKFSEKVVSFKQKRESNELQNMKSVHFGQCQEEESGKM